MKEVLTGNKTHFELSDEEFNKIKEADPMFIRFHSTNNSTTHEIAIHNDSKHGKALIRMFKDLTQRLDIKVNS